jgi:hypothetical protein
MSETIYYPRKPAETYDKLCVECGNTKRYVSNDQCVFCKLTKGNRYYHSHLDKLRKKNLKWAKDNPQKVRDNSRNWSHANPDRVRAMHVKTRYGLTPEQYNRLMFLQKGICAGCSNPATCVDHDHNCCPGERSCGKCVRGLLCKACNSTLGLAKDNTTTLRNLITYIETFSLTPTHS